jgi:hypothetical protein
MLLADRASTTLSNQLDEALVQGMALNCGVKRMARCLQVTPQAIRSRLHKAARATA